MGAGSATIGRATAVSRGDGDTATDTSASGVTYGGKWGLAAERTPVRWHTEPTHLKGRLQSRLLRFGWLLRQPPHGGRQGLHPTQCHVRHVDGLECGRG